MDKTRQYIQYCKITIDILRAYSIMHSNYIEFKTDEISPEDISIRIRAKSNSMP